MMVSVMIDCNVFKQITSLKSNNFEGCTCPKCAELLSTLAALLKSGLPNTRKFESSMELKHSAFELERLEFGQFSECPNQECCNILSEFKKFYGQYLEQWTKVQQKYAAARGHQLRSELLEIENEFLKHSLDMETKRTGIVRKHLELSNASYSGHVQMEKEEKELNKHAHFYGSGIEYKFTTWNTAKIENLEEQVKRLEYICSNMGQQFSRQMNLYYKDVVVSRLTQELQEFKTKFAELEENLNKKQVEIAELHRTVPQQSENQLEPVIINIGPCSFRTREAAVNFLSRPEVVNLAKWHVDHVFYDEHGLMMREFQKKFSSNAGLMEAFGTQEVEQLKHTVNRLKDENSELRSSIDIRDAELNSVKEELAELKETYEDSDDTPVQRTTYTAVVSGNGAFEEKFHKSFSVVREGESVQDENILYDFLFGKMTTPEKEAFLGWMYSCCNNGARIPKKAQKRMGEPLPARPGKKLFASCLAAIGGIYKDSYKDTCYKWINIRMNDTTKKRKLPEETAAASHVAV